MKMQQAISLNCFIFIFLLAVNSSWAASVKVINDPFDEGPFIVNQTDFYRLVNPTIDLNLGVFAPNEPGNFPVLYFVTGFAGITPSFAYTYLLSRIASHGFITIGIWREESPVNSFNESWFDSTIDFVENRLERNLHNEGYDAGMHVDYTRSFISGHSAGGHVPVVQLTAHCSNFIGQILLSPVDGADPFGMRPIFVITPGEKVSYTVPTLQIVTGLDPVPSGLSGFPCAPEELAGHRFYDAMIGPTWYINATAYGHEDFLDHYFQQMLEAMEFCGSDPSTPKDPYRNFQAGSIVSFMKGVLDPEGNCDYFDNLEVSGILGISTLNEHSPNGWSRCGPLQCINDSVV